MKPGSKHTRVLPKRGRVPHLHSSLQSVRLPTLPLRKEDCPKQDHILRWDDRTLLLTKTCDANKPNKRADDIQSNFWVSSYTSPQRAPPCTVTLCLSSDTTTLFSPSISITNPPLELAQVKQWFPPHLTAISIGGECDVAYDKMMGMSEGQTVERYIWLQDRQIWKSIKSLLVLWPRWWCQDRALDGEGMDIRHWLKLNLGGQRGSGQP